MSKELFDQRIKDSMLMKEALLSLTGVLAEMADVILHSYRQGCKVMLFGNGGSAVDAQHIAGEFVGRYYFDRPPLPALALTSDNAVLTAIGNDYGYELIFDRQVRGLGRKGDVAIGLSTSGNSPNVIRALAAAKEMGMTTMAFTGQREAAVDSIADYVVKVPTMDTPRIQEGYLFALHVICEYVERELFRRN